MQLRTVGLGVLLVAACSRGPRFGGLRTIVERGAAYPTVGVDPRAGTVYVVWAGQGPDSVWNIYLARTDSRNGFAAPVRVNDRPGDAVMAKENPPQVVVGWDGVVYVGWVSNRAPDQSPLPDISVRVARSSDGGATFEPSTTLRVGRAGGSLANMYSDLALAPDGALYVSWLDLHYYTDSSAAHEAHHVPDSVPVPDNRVDLRVARSIDGGRTFRAGAILDTGACICCRTAIALSPDGNPHVLWRHVFAGNVRDFYSASSPDRGNTFTSPVRVHEDGWAINGCPDIGPDIAVDQDHVVHAVWYTAAPNRVGLWYAASRDNGAHFDPPSALLTDRYVPPAEVKVASFGDRTWVVWEDRRRPQGVIRFAKAGRRGSASLGLGEYPTIAAGADHIAVAWVMNGAVHVRIADSALADR